MKRYLISAFCAVFLLTLPGCSLLAPKSTVTWEASRFLSFRDVYDVTYRSYLAHNVRVLDGKVSAKDDAEIDEAWNTFRAAYIIALNQAGGDDNKFTPDNVRNLAQDVLDLIAITL